MGKTRQSANLVSDNNIFVNVTTDRVGIGSTIPKSSLDVLGDINFSGSLNQGGTTFVASRWTAGIGSDIYRLSGDVGIGTTNPQYQLDVVGDINFTGTFRQNGTQFVASRWTSGTGDNIYRLNGNVGIATTNPTNPFQVGAGSTIVFVDNQGDLGIGTATATSKLHVQGDAQISGVVTATTFYGDGGQLSNISTGTDITSSLFS